MKTKLLYTKILDAMIDQYESYNAGDAADATLAERINAILMDIPLYRCYYNRYGLTELMDEVSENWMATEAEAKRCCRQMNALHPDEDEDTRYYAAQHKWSGDIDTNLDDYREALGQVGDRAFDKLIANTYSAQELRRWQAEECDRVQTTLDKHVAEKAKAAKAKALDKPLDMQ